MLKIFRRTGCRGVLSIYYTFLIIKNDLILFNAASLEMVAMFVLELDRFTYLLDVEVAVSRHSFNFHLKASLIYSDVQAIDFTAEHSMHDKYSA